MSSSDTSSECSYDSEDSEIFFIRDYDVGVEDGFESTNDTDSNESIEEINLVPRVLSLLRESTLVTAGHVSARF